MALKLMTWNVRGLNQRPKRHRVFYSLEKKNLDIICLQETHVVRRHRRILQNKKLGQEFISSDKVKKRGVVIYAKEKYNPRQLFKDERRYIAIEIKVQGDKYLILGLYAPNDGKSIFL